MKREDKPRSRNPWLDFWHWFIVRIHRPSIVDDEEWNQWIYEHAAIKPAWMWRLWLEERYGSGTVERVSSDSQHGEFPWQGTFPALTDTCRGYHDGRCNRSCERH